MIYKALLFCVISIVATPAFTNTLPAAYPGLKASAYTLITAKTERADYKSMTLSTADTDFQFEIEQLSRHENGDVSITGFAEGPNAVLNATFGQNSAFGEITSADHHFILTTNHSGIWMVELPQTGLVHNTCASTLSHPTETKKQRNTQAKDFSAVLDVLITFNQAFSDRYPGNLLQTRVNQYVQVANQTLANSGLSIGVRVVGSEFFNYRNDNTNAELLNDMANTLSGITAQGLEGLRTRRDALGADLVIMLRPHDIETRGSCGIAFFPQRGPDFGVNVVSDGMSSWSICSDQVFIHEIGHNLGAGHQNGSGGGAFDPRGAAVAALGQFNTVMGSFGTGRPDRFRELPMFSNPELQCGGQNCGDFNSNNTAVINEQITIVSNYRPSSSTAPIPEELSREQTDSDGDGRIDWDDRFPFDASETDDADADGFGDNQDAFPQNPLENTDTDLDGVGNNADPDNDNDNVIDLLDRFPLKANESFDDDNDGVGNNQDRFPDNALEQLDFDQDTIGDNADTDDDNDGFEDLEPSNQDILVISTGNSRALRFDAQTGASRGVEILREDGLFTFQSDLAYRSSDQRIFYLADSQVRQFDPYRRQTVSTFIPAFDDINPANPQLRSGFPNGITVFDNDRRMAVSRLENAQIALFNGQQQAVTEAQFAWFLSAAEHPIDIIADGSSSIILGQLNRAIYRADTNGNISFISAPNTPWMQDPYRMALSGDGRLFISDQGRNSVVAIDLTSGSFLGDFADLTAQGFSNPTGLTVTQNGKLLVASADQNSILSFDAQTGIYEGELVASSTGGLSQPYAMIAVPQIRDRFNHDPDRVIRPNGGLWANQQTNGRGFDIQVFNQRLTAIWYTYDEQGLPLWYLSAGDLNGFDYQAALQQTRLNTDGSLEITTVGNLSLNFESERIAQLSWTIDDASGSETLQWLEFDVEPADNNFTGIWGREDGPGWGVTLVTQGNRTVSLAFIYDQVGQPRWTISDPVSNNASSGNTTLNFPMNAVFSDTLCPVCSGVSEFETFSAGTISLSVPENADWSSDIVFPQPAIGLWELDQTPIIRFSETPQRPR